MARGLLVNHGLRRRFQTTLLLRGPAGRCGSFGRLRQRAVAAGAGLQAFLRQTQRGRDRLRRPGRGGSERCRARPRTSSRSAMWTTSRAAANFKKFEKQPKYKDFRVMLDKEGKNIDACTIGIPDFMHATVALACMQRGKHVYVEKPLTRTAGRRALLLEAAQKYKVATQMGNQGFSHECTRVAAEIVWSGAIGDVTEAHISTTPGTHPTGLQQLPPEELGAGLARLGSVARRGGHAAVQPVLRAVQLARLLGFRHGTDRQLGHPHRRARSTSRCNSARPPAWSASARSARATSRSRTAAWSGWTSRRAAGCPPVKVFYHDSMHTERSGSRTTCPAWRTRRSCRRRTT